MGGRAFDFRLNVLGTVTVVTIYFVRIEYSFLGPNYPTILYMGPILNLD